ncbi:hypothetical protein ACIGBK_32990 [Streptomyces microflavus]|uniref:hypothetical protein n=1 Tax=Streptomyces microflavus TaxID=1919 RepID=UPI0037D42884
MRGTEVGRLFPVVTAALVLALALALSACGSEEGVSGGGSVQGAESGERGRMDMQEAAERSDAMLDAVLGAIDPDVQWAHGPTTTRACGVTRRRAVMTVISADRRQTFLDRAEAFWRKSDYRIKAVNKDDVFPAVYAVTKAGFGVSVSFRGKGQAFLEADSPCVKESKVAPPATEPNGPAYEGVYPLPRPAVRSDFWSGKSGESGEGS